MCNIIEVRSLVYYLKHHNINKLYDFRYNITILKPISVVLLTARVLHKIVRVETLARIKVHQYN